MHAQSRAGRWGAVLFVLLLTASVGFWAYRVGVAHGVAQGVAMNLAAAGPEAAKAAPNVAPNAPAPYGPYPYPHPYGWPPYGRHPHWGWGFFPFGPLLFLAFWFFVVRMLLWRGPWRGGPWRRRGWYDGDRDPYHVSRRL